MADFAFPGAGLSSGLTKLQYFAAHAPETIPEWFRKGYVLSPPSKPESWNDNTREKYQKAMREYERLDYEDTYFAWRSYYAAKMIALNL